jgi:hypothetical protein
MATTIKTGTTPIEECVLMPESSRFANEPWTPFYVAGEIIRESRKASGKQGKYAGERNTARSDEGIDHYDHPRSASCLPKDDPSVGTGVVVAPECGDVSELQMKINSEPQVIQEAEFKVFGCGWSITVPSLPTEGSDGKTLRKRWPSRTRISSASSPFPRATVLDPTGYPGIGPRLHLGSIVS